MERLTIEKCGELLIKNNDNEYRSPCFGCESVDECKPEKVSCGFYKALEKLKEYEDMEEQGKLLKLPCNVGDNIYIILHNRQIQKSEVVEFKIIDKKWAVETYGWFYMFDEFGKTVFITKEEAESALKEMEDKHETD